ncbi:MAG TPA: alkaline phosphatase family protein, partial [Vicinamibacteria bacterium]|nr:alkaline phosphatase family protein [Vicinamibacteria bacterium]
SYRVMILGFDGMDPEFLESMLSQGKLPNFQKLMREGAYAPCRSFKPTKSVVLWTSVATGKRMEKHGIVDWQLLSDDGRKVLASGGSRRTEALWNIVTSSGKTVQILNWWASWPAEEVNGQIVSNHFPRSLHEPIAEATFPEDLAGELRGLGMPDRAEAERVLSESGIPVFSRELALAAFRPSTQFRARFRTAAGVFNDDMITEKSLAYLMNGRGQADLVAALFRTTDVYTHFLWRFIDRRVAVPVYAALRERGEPVTESISHAMDEAYARVLEPVYLHEDRRLGRLMDMAGPDTVLMVVSDHGFQFRDYGFNHYDDGRGDVRAPEGVLFLWGPAIRKGARLLSPSLFDLAPTSLYLMGLPVGRDMDGRVLTEALTPVLLARRSIGHVDSYDRAPRGGPVRPSPLDEKVLRELRALGYIP